MASADELKISISKKSETLKFSFVELEAEFGLALALNKYRAAHYFLAARCVLFITFFARRFFTIKHFRATIPKINKT